MMMLMAVECIFPTPTLLFHQRTCREHTPLEIRRLDSHRYPSSVGQQVAVIPLRNMYARKIHLSYANLLNWDLASTKMPSSIKMYKCSACFPLQHVWILHNIIRSVQRPSARFQGLMATKPAFNSHYLANERVKLNNCQKTRPFLSFKASHIHKRWALYVKLMDVAFCEHAARPSSLDTCVCDGCTEAWDSIEISSILSSLNSLLEPTPEFNEEWAEVCMTYSLQELLLYDGDGDGIMLKVEADCAIY